MAESKLRDLSMDFPVKVLKLYDGIKGHFSITNQLERSAPQSVQISAKHNMPTVQRILSLSFKFLSKKLTSQAQRIFAPSAKAGKL